MRILNAPSLAVRIAARFRTFGVSQVVLALFFAGVTGSIAEGTNDEVQELRAQNAMLRQQLQKEDDALEVLSNKVSRLEVAQAERDRYAAEKGPDETPQRTGLNLGGVHINGEGGVAVFNTGAEGFAPETDFRVDEARLFVEAPIWKEVYFYTEVDLATRENPGLGVNLNELYLDAQDVSQLWGRDNQLNIRAGRLDIPFGEEYEHRFAIDDPLISHSLSDIWGVDPGIEIYGSFEPVSYVVAVQNGGIAGTHDFSGDKSVAGRIGVDPTTWLHASVSAMRTGRETVGGDGMSALWFGNTFFQNIGSPGTTAFHANLVEGDVSTHWPGGQLAAFGGYARYGDDDPLGANRRNIYFYSVEAQQDLVKKFYAATRFSGITCAGGIPIRGFGNGGYTTGTPTTRLWRLSLGLGYRFSEQLVVKTEYSFERGREASGESRHREDFAGAEAAFKF